jgi:hypothetical protein
LLDKGEMECRRVGNGLDVVLISYIDRGDCWMRLPFDEQGWDRLRKNKRRIKIGILVAAAIPRPPTGIDDKLHEIGEPQFSLVGPCRLAALQSREFTQVNRRRVDRLKLSVEEVVMAELILGIVVDVLRHVPIEVVQRIGVGRVPPGGKSWNLAVLNSSKLGILLPEIALDL